MCGRLRISQAYSQAYHHQANGRAERASQQLQEKMRNMHVESRLNWVEALPQVLDRIHYTVGEAGYSPYEKHFLWRERPLAGLPYEPEQECEDAVSFFRRQARVDKEVAKILNEKHEKQGGSLNFKRTDSFPSRIPR